MPPTTPTRKRRSHWQMIAAKKLPYSSHAGGDGPFVVLARCTGQQNKHWRYWLFGTDDAATAWRSKLDSVGCQRECKGKAEHRQWQLMPWS